MTNPREEELISAYLDGELTADEQAQVERLLAESAELRQLHDDLRALRSGLESLPRHRAPGDLSQEVLRRVAPVAPSQAGGGDAPSELSRLPFPRAARSWIWAGAAIAAAVLIMIFGPQRPSDRPVALHEGDETAKDLEDFAAAKHGAVDDRGRVHLSDDETVQLGTDLHDEHTPESEGITADGQHLSKSSKIAANGKWGLEGDSTAGKLAKSLDKAAAQSRFTGGGMGGGMGGGGFANNMQSRAQRLQLRQSDLDTDGARGVIDKIVVSNQARDNQMADDSPVNDFALLREKDKLGDNYSARLDPNSVLVVSCTVTPQAEQRKAFEKVLTSNSIVVESLAEGNRSPNSTPKSKSMESSEAARRGGSDASATQNVDLFYVEATPRQVEATLAELKAQRNQFLSVDVDPAPNAANQQSLSFYNYNNASHGEAVVRQRAMNESLRRELQRLQEIGVTQQANQNGRAGLNDSRKALNGNQANLADNDKKSDAAAATAPSKQQREDTANHTLDQKASGPGSGGSRPIVAASQQPAGGAVQGDLKAPQRKRAVSDGLSKEELSQREAVTKSPSAPESRTLAGQQAAPTPSQVAKPQAAGGSGATVRELGLESSLQSPGPAAEESARNSEKSKATKEALSSDSLSILGRKENDAKLRTPTISARPSSERQSENQTAPRKQGQAAEQARPSVNASSDGSPALPQLAAGEQSQIGEQMRVLFMLRVVDPPHRAPSNKKARN